LNAAQLGKIDMDEPTSYRRMVMAVLRSRKFHMFFLIFLFGYYALLYYFGELVDLFGLEVLRWDFFYSIHDIHRFFFLVPIVYAGYIFRVKGAVLVIIASLIVFLPRASIITPFPDPMIRTIVFTVGAGTIGILTGIVRNESERRSRLEIAMRNERDKLVGILERMEEGVLIVGPDYRIRFMNSSMVREFGEGVGSPCFTYLHGIDTPCQICRLANVIRGMTERWEYDFPDGRTYEVLASPYVDSDGAVCKLATFRNITQRKKYEMELIELNKLKSELLSNVSHELKSPLTSIKGSVSSLLQKDVNWDVETQEMLLTGISDETDRLVGLVTNLLNMSKLEAGVWQPEKERCYISDIINGALEQQKLIHKSHVFKTDIAPNLPEIYADYGQIRQVLINLIENAAAYSEEGTLITVRAKKVSDDVEVSISDQGVGIPKEDLARIFDKFYRGIHKRWKPVGTGLGLAICQAIIANHNGRIWAESEIGRGSIFHFRLPIAG